jgi:hypothetical protein
MSEKIEGLKCPICEEEAMVPINHLYSKVGLGVRWFHCEACDRDVMKDPISSSWKIAAYEFDDEEEEEE